MNILKQTLTPYGLGSFCSPASVLIFGDDIDASTTNAPSLVAELQPLLPQFWVRIMPITPDYPKPTICISPSKPKPAPKVANQASDTHLEQLLATKIAESKATQ